MPDEGERLNLGDALLSFKAQSDDTFGAWTLFEYAMPALFAGPAPHWHKRTTEALFVLEGDIHVHLDGRDIHLPVGGFALATPGLVHTFSNPTTTLARVLILASPGGVERYFDEVAALLSREAHWPPRDMSAYEKLALKHDTYPPGEMN